MYKTSIIEYLAGIQISYEKEWKEKEKGEKKTTSYKKIVGFIKNFIHTKQEKIPFFFREITGLSLPT